jgi:organic hydroperoxide reductase OsmC/OhrA
MDMTDLPLRVGRIRLAPTIEVVAGSDPDQVVRMSHQAHEECFIASSLTSTMELDVTVVTR